MHHSASPPRLRKYYTPKVNYKASHIIPYYISPFARKVNKNV